jgi:glycosyltransferase involved in cell wall biosynthesis
LTSTDSQLIQNEKIIEKEKLELKPVVSVILPALNEEEAIRKVINEIPLEKMPPTEILVVDGCSDDRTRQIAKDCGAKVIIENNKGYDQAMDTGLKLCKGDVIVWMDSDYTYPSYQIPEIINPILENKADIVLGSRIKGRIQPGAMIPTHHFGNILLTMLYNILFFQFVSDTQTGLRAFNKKTLGFIDFKLNKRGWGFGWNTQMLTQAAKKRLRIKEIKIDFRPRLGCSKLSTLKDGARILIQILKGIFF